MSWDLHKLFEAHASEIMRFLQRRGSSPDLAADLTQDAFVRLMTSSPMAPVENSSAYLFRIARNLAINHDRRQRLLSFSSDPDVLLELADDAPSPERVLMSRQELGLVKIVFDELPPLQRQIFILARIEGRTFADIGRVLGVSPQTAYGHMTRILVRLKLRLDDARA